MRLRSTASLVLVLMALTNSCTSASTEPTGDPSTLSFTYTGYRNGAYSVTGFQPDPRTGLLNVTPWASATNFAIERSYTQIGGSLPAGAHVHIMQFVVPFGETGTFPLGAVHADGFIYDLLTFEYDPISGAGERYRLLPSTVTVTSVTSDRVIGTFTGTAVDSVNARTITITNGSFNVFVAPQ
jgi:hypothetical protein